MDKKKATIIILALFLVTVFIFVLIYQLKPKKIALPANQQKIDREAERQKNITVMKALLDQTAKEIAASSTLQKQVEKNKKEMSNLLNDTAKTIATSSTLQKEQAENVEAMKKLLEASSQQ